MMRFQRAWLLIVALLLGVLATPALAQTQRVEYGTFTIGNLTATSPAVFYNFTGNAGDIIFVEAKALTGGINPRVSLLNANSATLGVNNDDFFQPGSTDARLNYRLTETTTYTILVEGEASSTGQFLMRLERRDLGTPEPLSVGIVAPVSVSFDVPQKVYSFETANPATLTLSTTSTEVGFVAELLDPSGQLIALQASNGLPSVSMGISGATGSYLLVMRSTSRGTSGNFEVRLDAGGAAPAPQVAAPPAPTPETAAAPPTTDTSAPADTAQQPPAPTPETAAAPPAAETSAEGSALGGDTVSGAPPTNRCNVSPAQGGVIIRQGPSTSFPQISSIPQGEFRFADGTDGAWIRLVGGGWVSSGVVTQNGPCEGLPLVSADAPPASSGEAAPPPAAPTAAPLGQRN